MALVSLPVSNSDSSFQNVDNKENEGLGELISIPSPAKTTKKRLLRQGSVSENFYAVHGASLILPRQSTVDDKYMEVMQGKKFGGDLKTHLRGICSIIRQQDSIKLVARLESWVKDRPRYLVIITTNGRQDTDESIIIGIDFDISDNPKCTIGLVIPIWTDTAIALDGDGGFQITGRDRTHTFKPVSVQAMWSALQSVHKCIDIARQYNYYFGSLYLTWTCYYESRVDSARLFLNEWEYLEECYTRKPNYFEMKDPSSEAIELKIRGKLKEIMMKMDLDNCNSRDIREALEKVTDLDLNEYKKYIDKEMMTILGQMDTASKILDFLYLGSGWNASDLEGLEDVGITHILNITMEIDNFFPDNFVYKNVRLYDEETSDLLPEWNDTWKFIKRAHRSHGKCLVHCKMGISRSAATVAAFLMKENLWSMEKALTFIRERRGIIHPNKGFMRQLQEYEGILNASAQRHNLLFRSFSESNLTGENEMTEKSEESHTPRGSIVEQQPTFDLNRKLLDLTVLPYSTMHKKPKSWSPGDVRHYCLDDEVIFINRYDQGSDMNRSNLSEPQDFLAQSEKFAKDRGIPHAVNKRKKWRRRHTERIIPLRDSEFESAAQSEDSVFANPGTVPIPLIDTWMMETRSLPVDTKKKTGRMSSPAAMETCKDSLDVDREPVHSSFVSPMNSPSFKCTKDVNVANLKNQFIDAVLQVDITGGGKEPIMQQTDLPSASAYKVTSPLTENISEGNVESLEDVENESRDVVGQLSSRERSLSENQLYVKNIVCEIESRGKENQESTKVGLSRSQSLTTSKNSSIAITLGDPTQKVSDQSLNNNNNNNNNIMIPLFPSTTVIEIDHDMNNTPQIMRTTSQSGCSITEKVAPSDIALASSPSDVERKRNIFVRTLTQSELHVIREVGKTFLSESEDSESLLMSESSSLTGSCASTLDSESQLFKKQGVVRRMAKMIENRIGDQHKEEHPDPHKDTKFTEVKSSQSSTDSTTVINKLLMGGTNAASISVQDTERNKENSNNLACSGELDQKTEPKSQAMSKLNDLLSLVGPTPYSPIHTSLASVTSDVFDKSYVERYQRKGRVPIRRTQSERSFARPIKSLFFHSFREKPMANTETDSVKSPHLDEGTQIQSEQVAVKQIVKNIENLGIADENLQKRNEFARKKRLFSGDSPKYQSKQHAKSSVIRSNSNPSSTQKSETHRNIKLFSKSPFSGNKSRVKYSQTQFPRHSNLYKTM